MAERSGEFDRGWAAALLATKHWHEDQASKAMVQARRSRFPKNFEREAELHRRCAEQVEAITPEDL